jgi:nitrite reductase/ring-hydroxylating ferredoxin subunit
VRRLERLVVIAVALHSVAVGLVLLFATVWGLRLGGFVVPPSLFFARQAGAFHVVVAAGYLIEYLRHRSVRFLVLTKTIAVAFLLAETVRGAPWCVPASAAGDAAMAILVLGVHAAAGREARPRVVDGSRRGVVRALSGLLVVIGAALSGLAAACTRPAAEPDPRRTLRVAMQTVLARGRVVVFNEDEPIEVRWTGEEWTAHSLLCTHFGCTVAWREAASRYECPCHGGAFDTVGRPVEGPPTAALRALPVRREGAFLVVTVS